MAEEHLKLASAGDDIKIWDASNYQITHQFSTHLAASFHNVHWSCDLQQLVSVPTSGSFLLLTLVKQQSVQHIEVDTKIPNTVAKFSSTTPRFLGIGSKYGDIVFWDIKHSKPKKALKCSNGEVTCLQFNWNDSHMASGFVDGNIVLHNTTTGQSTSPLHTPNSQAIRDLHYSYIKKGLIGCASDDGTVALWDANTRQPYHLFSAVHSAPATSLSFSPVNYLLLASVGLDKKIICYDTQVKRLVKSLNCESPLTSLDLKKDGVTLAAGSSRGVIYIFDLRSHTVPVHTISAHSSSVQSLSFQNTSVGSLLKKDPSKLCNKYEADVASEPFIFHKNMMEGPPVHLKAAIPSYVQSARHPHLQDIQRGSLTSEIFSPLKAAIPSYVQSARHPHLQVIQRDSLTSEIFSPLKGIPAEKHGEVLVKDVDSSLGNLPIPYTDVTEHSISQVNDPSQLVFKRDSLTDEIFSPVRDISGLPTKTPLKPVPHFVDIRPTPSAGEAVSPLPSEDTSIFSSPRRLQAQGAGENILSSPPILSTKSAFNNLPSTELYQLAFSSISSEVPSETGLRVQFETESFRIPDEPSETVTAAVDKDVKFQCSKVNDLEASRFCEMAPESSESMEFDAGANASDNRSIASEELPNLLQKECITEFVADEGNGSSEPVTPMTPQAFQAEFIRQIVDDAMEECRQEIRQSFLHYYIQMVRQFERQKAEMEELLQRYSINDELITEIKRLKEENSHLRATF